jgi:hypothetical protein
MLVVLSFQSPNVVVLEVSISPPRKVGPDVVIQSWMQNIETEIPRKCASQYSIAMPLSSVQAPRTCANTEEWSTPKLGPWIAKKIEQSGVKKSICPLLVVFDGFAVHLRLEQKEDHPRK